MTENRIEWVDMARGISMLAIILFHTEVYYSGKDIIPYSMYVEDFLAVFFILSGYLFLKPGKDMNPKRKLRSIFRHIVIPYLFFTTIISVPKALVHGRQIDIAEIALNILNGEASWFVSSLILSECYFMLIHWASKGKLPLLSFFSIMPFALYMTFPGIKEYSIPCVSTISTVFIFIGYIYRRTEIKVQSCLKILLPLSVVLLAIMKTYEIYNDSKMIFYWMDVDNYMLFFADTICFSYILINICCKIGRNRYIEWIGKRSLVYYFLCGGVPLIISKALPAYTEGTYLMVIMAFLLSVAASTVITFFIYKYLPFILGR